MNPWLAFGVSIAAAVVVAWASRRLLGATRVSSVRTAVAAVVGIVFGWGVGVLINRDADVTTEDAAVTAGVLALLFAMIMIIGFELTARPRRSVPGSTDRKSNPIAAVRDSWNDTRRVKEIISVARQHDLFVAAGRVSADETDQHAGAEFGRSLRTTFEDLGGVFVKLGQILSTRPDILPPSALDELSHLQGQVAPAPRDAIEEQLAATFGRPVEEVFAEFDWHPLGSASIGQVYRARLLTGEPVVVKVRRPGVVEAIQRDLSVILHLAESLERRAEWARTYGAVSFARSFAAALEAELDFSRELANIRRIKLSFADAQSLYIPAVYPDLSDDAVLVMHVVEGPSVGRVGRDGTALQDGPQMASDLFKAELSAMVEGGEFHADPHPGNIVVMGPGQLGLIDFGSTGRLDAFERGAVTDILAALQMRDPTLLREALMQVATVPDGTSPEALERSLARLLADRLGPGMEPTPELIVDFLSLVRQFRIQLPATLLMVFRTLGTMLGTLAILDPSFSIIDAARSLAGDEVEDRLTPSKVEEALREETLALLPILRRAPRHMDRIAGQMERGELTVRSRFLSHPDDVRTLTTIINRAVMAFVGATLGIVSVMMFRTAGGPAVTPDLGLYELFGWIGLVTGAVLLMRVVLEILQAEP